MKKILLVDDEPHVIKVLKLFLDKDGYSVSVANNGEQAMEKVSSVSPDVVITDIQMPKMTGQELCEKLEQKFRDTKPYIIVMTSRTDTDLRTWINGASDIEFLEKPLSPRKLVNRLRTYFQQLDIDEGVVT